MAQVVREEVRILLCDISALQKRENTTPPKQNEQFKSQPHKNSKGQHLKHWRLQQDGEKRMLCTFCCAFVYG
jgi:hypothetical protein